MAYDKFYIAPIDGGLQKNFTPFMIPDKAFSRLQNAHVYRGRVRKRFGSLYMDPTAPLAVAQLSSRLRVQVGTVTAPDASVPGTRFKEGQMFSAGDQIFTVITSGVAQPMITTGPGNGTFSTNNGNFTIAGTGLPGVTPIFFYPAEPVMGLEVFENPAVNEEQLIAFDTQFAYTYTGNGFDRFGTATWRSTTSEFFWSLSYRGANEYDIIFFVSNYHIGANLAATDPIRYYDRNTSAWVSFTPGFRSGLATSVIVTALIMMPFKDRLLLINVVEDTAADGLRVYRNRLRYSQAGNALATDAFFDVERATGANGDPTYGKGGAIDAPTSEAAISAEFIKDRLIVYFERSTWEIVDTGNQQIPFGWQKINTELGAESTFSMVPFDKVVIGVGNVGIHACNGINVERIDEKIPDEVFAIHNANDGVKRVHGVRDYTSELVYWTFPSVVRSAEAPWPDRVLVYNYLNGTWAFNDDSITTFGYFQPSEGITWNSTDITWDNTQVTWDSGSLQAIFRKVVAGNQQGFVFRIEPDVTRNERVLSVTNIELDGATQVVVTARDHNLKVNEFIEISFLNGLAGPFLPIYEIVFVIDEHTFIIIAPDIRASLINGDVYSGGGVIARVSRIDILTKQYNFYKQVASNAALNKIDFLLDKTEAGEITVDYKPSFSSQGLLDDSILGGTQLGNGVLQTSPYLLHPLEQQQERLYHSVYTFLEGETVQLRLYITDEQMLNFDVFVSPFQLHAMIFYAQKSGRIQ